jgi:hypothetical protein
MAENQGEAGNVGNRLLGGVPLGGHLEKIPWGAEGILGAGENERQNVEV